MRVYYIAAGGIGHTPIAYHARPVEKKLKHLMIEPVHEPKSGRITCRHKNRVISKHGRMGRIIGWTEVRLLPDISQSIAEVPKMDTKKLSLEKTLLILLDYLLVLNQ